MGAWHGRQIAHLTINTAKRSSDSSSINGITVEDHECPAGRWFHNDMMESVQVWSSKYHHGKCFNQPATEIIVPFFRPPITAEGVIKASQEIDG